MQAFLSVFDDQDIDDLAAQVGQIQNGSDVFIDMTGYVSQNPDEKPVKAVERVTFAVRYASYVDDKQFNSISLDGIRTFSPKCARNISWTLINNIYINFIERGYLDSESKQILRNQFKEIFVNGSRIKGNDTGSDGNEEVS